MVPRGRPRQRTPSTRHYLWKRALRILPLYWVVVVVALLLDPANHDADWRDWVSNLTLTQLYRPDLLPSSLTQMWSLCTEVAFYVVLPLLCLAFLGPRGRGLGLRRVLGGAGVLSVARGGLAGRAWTQIPGCEGHYAQWLPGFLPWFVVGMAFAAVSAQPHRPPARPRPRPAGRRPHRLLDRRRRGLRHRLHPAGRPAAAPDPRRLGGRREGRAVRRRGAFLLLPLVFGPEREGWVRER